MPASTSANLIQANIQLLRGPATRAALVGALIGLAAVVLASLLVSQIHYGSITLETIMRVQRENVALWILDITPFAFAIWGQYVGGMLVQRAGRLVLDQTQDLRNEAATLKLQMRRRATRDELTGLANRAVFIDRLEQAVAAAAARRERCAVLALDLRRFTQINETLGHHQGDRLLKRVAVRLNSALEAPITLARIRGKEFGIILPSLENEDAVRATMNKIRDALDAPFKVDDLSIEIQSVAGAAIYPDHGEDAQLLIQNMDIALHAAKKQDQDLLIYDPAQDRSSPQRLTLMGELRRAIGRQEMCLYLQPVVDASGQRLIGCESLVRWEHPQFGMVGPGDFIPLAEQSGAIVELTNWVIGEAMSHARELRDAGQDIWVSTNVSARCLMDPDFVDTLTGAMARTGVKAEGIVLEITEDTLMGEQSQVQGVCAELADLGFRLAIDDFGTGYSQLAYLRRLPVKEIKIDRSFVLDMLENQNDEVIVKATIDLAHTLGLGVIAEGIETEAHRDRLEAMGCDALQGYLFARPMPIEKLMDWLRERDADATASTDQS